MEHLFHIWQRFASAVRDAPHVLFLSDYDGTLTPIVGRPEDAVLSPDVRRKLRELSQKPGFSVGIISGRSLEDTRGLVAVDGIYYAGNHGLEIKGPGIDYLSPVAREARGMMSELAGRLAEALEDVPGVIIQDKGLSLSVHYRLVAPAQEKDVAAAVAELTSPMVEAGKVALFTGKKVWEVKPPIDWHKGKAVESIRHEITRALSVSNTLTMFLGDDLTDEDGFGVLHPPDGWGIYVGGDNDSSRASCYLDSPQEVAELLSRLIDLD